MPSEKNWKAVSKALCTGMRQTLTEVGQSLCETASEVGPYIGGGIPSIARATITHCESVRTRTPIQRDDGEEPGVPFLMVLTNGLTMGVVKMVSEKFGLNPWGAALAYTAAASVAAEFAPVLVDEFRDRANRLNGQKQERARWRSAEFLPEPEERPSGITGDFATDASYEP